MPFSYSPTDPSAGEFASPWCEAIQQDPKWEPIPTMSLVLRDGGENSLVADTLSTRRGIRGIRTYLRRDGSASPTLPGTIPPQQGYPTGLAVEMVMLWSLGDGVNGGPKACHGGLIALMLDEITGELAAESLGREKIVTAGLNVSYKKRLFTPAVVLCKARFKEGGPQGRKVLIEGEITDGEGNVFASGQVVYVKLRSEAKI